jgi:hypothetical protein
MGEGLQGEGKLNRLVGVIFAAIGVMMIVIK